MSSVRTAPLGRSTETSTARVDAVGLYRVALWILLGANLLAAWGVQWDIQWHVQIGRDSFWIPPHVMTYAGVAILALASFGVLARDTLRHRLAGRAPEGNLRILGLTGTRGFLLAACGIALISSLGNLGPAVSPSLNGLIQQWTGSTAYSMYLVMVMYVLAGVILLAVVSAAGKTEESTA